MTTANYLVIGFSEAQLKMEPYQKADEVGELQEYLRGQKIRGIERLSLFCSAEFYIRTDRQRALGQRSTGPVFIQEAVYLQTGQISSIPHFTEAQKTAIEMLGFKTHTEERMLPRFFLK